MRVLESQSLTFPPLYTVLFFPIIVLSLIIVIVVVGIMKGHKKILSSYLSILLSDRCNALYKEHQMQGPLKNQNSFALNSNLQKSQRTNRTQGTSSRSSKPGKDKMQQEWRESVSTMFGVTRSL